MKTVIVLGASGMLGSAVAQELETTSRYRVLKSYRQEDQKSGDSDNWFYYDALKNSVEDLSKVVEREKPEYIVNCIGIIKPHMSKGIEAAIKINSLLPHELGRVCNDAETKLIHITTDCAYSGREGKYKESDLHDALDDYGKSKSLGEPIDTSMVLRTSIIGEEVHSFVSLISWVKSQHGKSVFGFTNHLWNGITTNQYGKICDQIINNDLWETGLFHVFSPNDVNKLQLVTAIRDRYKLDIEITPHEADCAVDRTLRTEKNLVSSLTIPSVETQISEIPDRDTN